MIEVPVERKAETWTDPKQAQIEAKTWSCPALANAQVNVVAVECDGEKRYAVQVQSGNNTAIYGRHGLDQKGQLWPFNKTNELNITARFECARRLIAMSQRLAQVSNGQGALSTQALTPPISIIYVGTLQKRLLVVKELQKLDTQQGITTMGHTEDFKADLFAVSDYLGQDAAHCASIVTLFCQAYPTFVQNDFKLQDKSGRTAPIPQQGEQQQAEIVPNGTNRNEHIDGPTTSTPYGEMIPFINNTQ